MAADIEIALARAADLPALPAIERAAARLFDGLAISSEALAIATAPEEFAESQQAGLLWVARVAGKPVGFAQVDLVGGEPHLEEIDVHPDFGRRGIGRALVRAVQDWARASGARGLTLTTFRELAWNEPFYASCGFRELAPAELSPELRAVVDDETRRGLDPAQRTVMLWRPRG